MRATFRALILMTLAVVAARAPAVAPTPPAGAWTQFRGDAALSGRSRAKGRIITPAVVWKQFIGARETLLRVQPGRSAGPHAPLPVDDLNPARAGEVETAWGLNGFLYDLDGNGAKTPSLTSSTTRVAKVLPQERGPQLIEFESAFSKPGNAPTAVGRLKARRNGQWTQLWETQPIPMLYQPNSIVGDFDGDGRMEIAVTPWYDLWILDAATGALKAKERFMPPDAESGRAYGWVGAFDLDGDGRQEFVVLGDFENFMAVLGWKDGRLVRLWYRLIERGITRKETIFRPGADPVQDVDGDGHPEIVVSLFNASGDGRWHVQVLEGMTGRVKADLPDRYLSGLRDVDGDGTAELFLTRTAGALIPERSRLEVVSLKGGRQATRLEVPDAAFVSANLTDFPPNVNSGAGTGRRTLLAGRLRPGGPVAFFTRRTLDPDSGTVEVTAWAYERGALREVGRIAGPRLEALATRSEGGSDSGLLLRASVSGDEPARLTLSHLAATPVVSRKIGAPLSPAVGARLTARSMPAVVAQGAAGETWAVALAAKGQEPRVRWRRPVRGMYTGTGTLAGGVPWGGVVLADLDGTGSLATFAAASAPEGHARLVALGPDGRERWRHDFPRFPGAPPEWNIGGLTMWFGGYFRDKRRCDVLVSLRRSTMHSDETYLLDGRTGAEVWKRTEGAHISSYVRGFGGAWMAVYDRNGDGLDGAAILYPDGVFVIDGATGKPLLDLDTNKRLFPDVWSFYATPAAVDFLGKGAPQLLYAANPYVMALLERDGKVIWRDGPFSGTPPVLPGIGDVDGDGRLELLCPGWPRAPGSEDPELRCLDAATGRVKWKLPMPGKAFGPLGEFRQPSPLAPSVADLDGDGRDECLIPIGNSLCAFGAAADGKSGQLRWKIELPGPIGPAAIIDTGGPSGVQAVVVCADGYLYGIGEAGSAPRGPEGVGSHRSE